MAEHILKVENISLSELYGPNDKHLVMMRERFPKLKIIARGEYVKVMGDDEEVDAFVERFNRLSNLIERNGKLDDKSVEQIMSAHSDATIGSTFNDSDVLVYGRGGNAIKALTVNQKRLVKACEENDLVFAIGPAGTGKTYTAVALAVRALKARQVKRIVLTRPAVEAGENLGFLPGDLKDKLDPYLQPLYDALHDMLPSAKLDSYIEERTIEIAPLAFMRGRTLDNAFVILDEAQNATQPQLRMFLTRMGRSAKFVVTGDVTQIDLPPRVPSGLPQAVKILNGVKGIGFVNLDEKDIVRHRLVNDIVNAYKKHFEKEREEENPTHEHKQ